MQPASVNLSWQNSGKDSDSLPSLSKPAERNVNAAPPNFARTPDTMQTTTWPKRSG